ncbi:hypothetical protein JW758_04485 [Candidatus Peregrinibacteria bacterium]|nr:hypothetical protein [Candidatus Peregrinibacteria bacterium]
MIEIHFKPVDLVVDKAADESNYLIGFNRSGVSDFDQIVYNDAIQAVLKEKQLYPRHIRKGYVSCWEALANPQKDELEKIIPEIHSKAKAIVENQIARVAEFKKRGELYEQIKKELRGEED